MKIQIESSTACNANCTFCPRASMTRPQGQMSDSLFHKLVQEGRQFQRPFFVPFLNGEPFLFPRIWEWLDYLKDDRVHIYTNASLVDVARLVQYKNISTICCSINAASKETYNKVVRGPDFQTVVQNTRDLIKHSKSRVYASMVIVGDNIHEVEDFQTFWGPNAIFGTFKNWAGAVHDTLEITGPRVPCWPLNHSINILHDGRVVPCCMDHDARLVIGDANYQSLQEIWWNNTYMRRRHRHGDFSMNPCHDCNHNLEATS